MWILTIFHLCQFTIQKKNGVSDFYHIKLCGFVLSIFFSHFLFLLVCTHTVFAWSLSFDLIENKRFVPSTQDHCHFKWKESQINLDNWNDLFKNRWKKLQRVRWKKKIRTKIRKLLTTSIDCHTVLHSKWSFNYNISGPSSWTMAQSGNFQSIGFFVNVLLLDCSKFSTITAFSIVHQVINGYHSLDNVKSIFPIRNGQSLILGRKCGFYFNRFKQTAVISWFNAINCGEMKIFNKYLTILIVSLQDFFLLLQLFLGFF